MSFDPPNDDAPRSPVKLRPLRLPGQSLDEEVRRIIDDDFMAYAVYACVALGLAALEWVRWMRPFPPQPIAMTLLAVLAWGALIYRFCNARERVRALRLGRDGERTVAAALEELIADDAAIIHDVPATTFNLDHVVISRFGVFVIETKTVSKRGRDPKATYDGLTLLVPGMPDPQRAVKQACAEAAWLRDLLRSMTGGDVEVQPVLVLPGWFVTATARIAPGACWVLNEKAFVKWARGAGDRLSAAKVAELAHHVRQHVRTCLASSDREAPN